MKYSNCVFGILYLLLSMWSSQVFGKTIFYSDQMRHVDLRSSSPSLLMFEAPVISVSCQPAWVELDSLTEKNIDLSEQNQIQAHVLQSEIKDGDSHLKRMLRIKPLSKEGSSQCVFVLANGEELSISFQLKEDINTPLIEFQPYEWSVDHSVSDPDLKALRSLLQGEPIGFEKRDHQICSAGKERMCRNYTVSTDLADYEVLYHGKNKSLSAWVIKAKLKKNESFNTTSNLSHSRSGTESLLHFSLSTPQKENFEKGETLTHYLLGKTNMLKEDLKGVLP